MNPAAQISKHEVSVTEIIQRTRDAKSVRFEKPEGFDYLPGQWVFITVGSETGEKTKPLSLSSSPTEDFLEVTKRLTGHEFSNALNGLRVGNKASIKGPYGNFTFRGEFDKVCMLSGGIGITPLRSIIKYSTDKSVKASIVLLYSNHSENDIPFDDDFKEMQRLNPNFRAMITVTKPGPDWKGLTGRIDRAMIAKAVPEYLERVFYICGPIPMVKAMRDLLDEMRLPETQIKQEYFTGYL